MKQCATCREFKDEEEFAWNNKLLRKRHKQCRSCMSRFNKESYERHSERHKARVKKTKEERKKKAKQYVVESFVLFVTERQLTKKEDGLWDN